MKPHAAWLNNTVKTGSQDPVTSAPRLAISAAVPRGTASRLAGVEIKLNRWKYLIESGSDPIHAAKARAK